MFTQAASRTAALLFLSLTGGDAYERLRDSYDYPDNSQLDRIHPYIYS